jgi:hypothetical protein
MAIVPATNPAACAHKPLTIAQIRKNMKAGQEKPVEPGLGQVVDQPLSADGRQALQGEWGVAQQPLSAVLVPALNANLGINREAPAMRPALHRLTVGLREPAAAHEPRAAPGGAPAPAPPPPPGLTVRRSRGTSPGRLHQVRRRTAHRIRRSGYAYGA